MNRIWNMGLLIAGVILLDQFTKGSIQSNFTIGESLPIIDGLFNFTYVQNTGAAFGFLAGASESIRAPLFLYLPVVACFWLVWLIWHTRKGPFLLCLAYSLVLAGAIGNLIDRFSLGYVVDFFDFYVKSSHFAVFNVADSAISIAAGLLIIDFLFFEKKRADKTPQEVKTSESVKKGL